MSIVDIVAAIVGLMMLGLMTWGADQARALLAADKERGVTRL